MCVPSQFVRDTVREFYQRFKLQSLTGLEATDDEICPAEDDLTEQLLDQNRVLRGRCGAVPLEVLKEGLQLARKYVDLLIDLLFSAMNFCMDIMQLMGPLDPGPRQTVTASLFYWFRQMIIQMGEVREGEQCACRSL